MNLRHPILTTLLMLSACNQAPELDADTTRYEMHIHNFTIDAIDQDIKAEQRGDPPHGGRASWNEKWIAQISHLRKSNSDLKYIDYIVKQRRSHGLPELDGL